MSGKTELVHLPSIKKNGYVSDLIKNRWRYLMILPVLAFYIIFSYVPMYGAIIAFKNFSPSLGILESPWVGWKHFQEFFEGVFFTRTLLNTLFISLNFIIFGFPSPIILALLINEVRSKHFAKAVQAVTYLPHFISLVVVCGMIKEFVADTGFINDIIAAFGGERVNMLNKATYFVPVYITSGIWQEIGWGSIIYLSAIAGIDQELYEAATVDGAGKFRQVMCITLPCLLPTIITLLILRVGNILNVGFEKIILLYTPVTYATADVISSYVYRKGLQEQNWSFSTAVGLFNGVINFALIITANYISKKKQNMSLW